MDALAKTFLSLCEYFQFTAVVFTFLMNSLTFQGCVDSVWSEEASSPGCVNCLLNDLDLTGMILKNLFF